MLRSFVILILLAGCTADRAESASVHQPLSEVAPLVCAPTVDFRGGRSCFGYVQVEGGRTYRVQRLEASGDIILRERGGVGVIDFRGDPRTIVENYAVPEDGRRYEVLREQFEG